MIFNNILTEQEILNIIMEYNVVESGFIFRSIYDENTNDITLSNFEFDDNGVLLEANISQKDLNIKLRKNQFNPRYVVIIGGDQASHSGRMKVSKNGIKIKRGDNVNDYISIYNDGNGIEYKGNLSNLHMDSKELNEYINLFSRNEDLIQFIRYSNNKYDHLADAAFINDEALRNAGYVVTRDRKNGNRYIYDENGNLLCKENIMGDKIL